MMTSHLTGLAPDFVINACHQLWRIEKSLRMSKHDLQGRPVYHHKCESSEAHLRIVFADLLSPHRAGNRLGKEDFVGTARRYRTVHTEGARQT
jgi:hypothetical protein